MEALFDLLGNPVIIFIVIGILSSLFNKAKGNGKDQQHRRPVRPAGKPVVMNVPPETKREPRPAPRPVQTRPARHMPVKAEQRTSQATDIQKVYEERKQQADITENRQRPAVSGRLSSDADSGRLRRTKEKPEYSFQFEPDQDRLIEGLIWAEVLGKPRSKKPYQTGGRD
jgi:hypothetical protein